MLIINKISKEYGDKSLFNDINLTIYDGERIGIVGVNGCGKSTFMNILSQQINADEGQVLVSGSCQYVRQVAEQVELNNTYSEDFVNFLKTNKELNCNNGLHQEFDTLSGGEQTKMMISFALAKNPDILLLDEPTNNLDQKSIEWLIDKLNNFNGTIITISHDRFFLDNVVDKILEFENGKVNEFYGNYTDYETQKQEKLAFDKKVYQEKLNENKKIKQQIDHLSSMTAKLEKSSKKDGSKDRRSSGYKDSVQSKVKKLAKQAQAKRNRLENLLDNLGERPYEQRNIFYKIDAEPLHSKLLVKLTDLSKSYANKTLFADVNLSIENGEKLALTGDNGSGKTTLIKIILGLESCKGEVWKSQNLKIAYLPQTAFKMDIDKTIFDLAGDFGQDKTQFLTNLCNMGMSKTMFNKKICDLSSGEKMKIKLNELILSDFNFLILDEPTNNLDIANKKFLEQVLKDYCGNLIIVSHDKALVSNVCNAELKIEDGKITKYNYN